MSPPPTLDPDTSDQLQHLPPASPGPSGGSLLNILRVLVPGGKVLLLEHGRSSWGWWNRSLDEGAQRHRSKWGCWWNRDILAIVHQAGLVVEYVSRWHFGTSYIIVASPARATHRDLAIP
ncbi:uncharacterized protein HaLaN_06916 [Haematococcus lacustris]|uniref:S-adenosyl-L-methionine-dependent methyltransferase n=1 Tax=Haematococcus lacustris TaxID=44745 RepID=A0A699YMU0_HAELA|nr:uncharacterized protein HaLaN_06916 [Haematococcus lacustris]